MSKGSLHKEVMLCRIIWRIISFNCTSFSNGTLDVAQCDSTQGLAAGMGCELGQTNGTEDLLFMDCIQAGVHSVTIQLYSETYIQDIYVLMPVIHIQHSENVFSKM